MDKYYKTLGLSPDRTEREVRRQYKKLEKNYNPDNFSEPGQKNMPGRQWKK